MGSMRSITKTSQTSQAFDRVLEWLGELRHERGHGNWAQLDRRLGHSEGYLGRVLRQEIRLTTDMLLRILEVLEVEPGLFFQHVFTPSSEPADILALLQRQMAGLRRADGSPEPDLEMATLAWLQDLGAVRQRLASQRPASNADAARDVVRTVLARQLEDIQEHPEARPEETKGALAEWLAQVSRGVSRDPDGMCDLLAKGLAMQSQILLKGEIPGQVCPAAACRHLQVAWDLAQGSDARAEVLLGSAHLAIRVGAVESAQLLVPQAIEAAALAQRPLAWGHALLLKGRLCELRRDWQHGGEAFAAALSFFGNAPVRLQTSVRLRWQGYLGRARCALEAGALDAAAHALDLADQCRPGDGHPQSRRDASEWVWLRGTWAEACGKREEAIVQYREVRQAHQASKHFAAALLVALREVRLLLTLGKQHELHRLTAQSMAWTRPLRRQQRMCEVITDMARLALTDRLDPQWLRAAEEELEPLAGLHGLTRAGLS